MIDALNGRDYPIISAINLIMATIVIANNLFIDLTYGCWTPGFITNRKKPKREFKS